MKTPEQIAQQVLDNHVIRDDWRRTGAQIRPLLAEAVEADRAQRRESAAPVRFPDHVLDEHSPDL